MACLLGFFQEVFVLRTTGIDKSDEVELPTLFVIIFIKLKCLLLRVLESLADKSR